MGGTQGARGRKPATGLGLTTRQRALVIALVIAAVGFDSLLFIASLPPSLTIHEGTTDGVVLANFPTTNSLNNIAFGNFTATTYINQTMGSASTLSLILHSHGFAVGGPTGAIDHVDFFYDVAVVGRFAATLRPAALQLACTVTGSNVSIDFYNNWDQGTNVSADRQQTFGFFDNGTGVLTANLMRPGGPGPWYEFEYGANGNSMFLYQHTELIAFRATVTGWMLPPISAAILMEIRNVPKVFTLYPTGTVFTVYGYNRTAFAIPTAAGFVVTGSFSATAPVTAYILNASQIWTFSGDAPPGSWTWSSPPGILSGSIEATLPPEQAWYLLFVRTPMPTSGPIPATNVTVAEPIVATT